MASKQGVVFFKRIMVLSTDTKKPIPSVRRFSFSSMGANDGGSVGPSIKDSNGFSDGGGDGRQSHHNPPQPIPNRPLRGERPLDHQFNTRQPDRTRRRQPPVNDRFMNDPVNVGDRDQASRRPPLQFLERTVADDQKTGRRRSDDDQLDKSFLERFKLGIEKKNSSDQTSNSQFPQQQEQGTEQKSNPEDADEIFRKMKETGLIPNAVAMLDGLCKDGLVQEAMKLFGLMREKGTIPEVVIYTAVVDGFCKAQKLDDAKRIFRKMQNNGIAPNAFSYGVLIQGLYKSNNLDDAIHFCIEMLEAGLSPNVATFVGLVDGLCRAKGVEEAQSVITTLRQKGFYLNEKATREYLDKKAPFSPPVWEAIFAKKMP